MVKVLQWNLQITGNSFYNASLAIENPFVLHQAIKN